MANAITLRKIPEDVFEILLEEQKEEKKRTKKGMFGLEQTIYKIIRDFNRNKKEAKK